MSFEFLLVIYIRNKIELAISKDQKDAPNSREFKKTIPNNMTQDKERLYEELNKSKQLANQLQMNNYQMRVQVKSLEQVLQKQFTSKDESLKYFLIQHQLQYLKHKKESYLIFLSYQSQFNLKNKQKTQMMKQKNSKRICLEFKGILNLWQSLSDFRKNAQDQKTYCINNC